MPPLDCVTQHPKPYRLGWLKLTGPSAELCSGVIKVWVGLATTIHTLKLCMCLLCRFLGCCCLGIWQLRKLPQMCRGLYSEPGIYIQLKFNSRLVVYPWEAFFHLTAALSFSSRPKLSQLSVFQVLIFWSAETSYAFHCLLCHGNPSKSKWLEESLPF